MAQMKDDKRLVFIPNQSVKADLINNSDLRLRIHMRRNKEQLINISHTKEHPRSEINSHETSTLCFHLVLGSDLSDRTSMNVQLCV